VSTINTLHGVARQTLKSTCPDLKQSKRNYVLTLSNISTTKGITKQISISTLSESIVLTKNGTPRNTKKSGTIGPSQFAQS